MGGIRSPPSENGSNGETSEVRRNIQDDWQRRDDIQLMTTAIKRLVDFLNQFGNEIYLVICFWDVSFSSESSCRYRLSILNEKLTALERHVDYLEARVRRLRFFVLFISSFSYRSAKAKHSINCSSSDSFYFCIFDIPKNR
jgi:uncharacterized protein